MNTTSRRGILAAVLSSSLGVGLIFGFQPPLIALVLSRSGSSAGTIGAVTATTLVAVILCGPLYPRFIESLGLKRSVTTGIGLGALILMCMPAASSVPFWVCLRFVTGCALGLSWIASEIWLNSASDESSRGTVMGVYGTVFSLGVVGGPLLLEWTGTEGMKPFVYGAVCLVLTLLPVMTLAGARPPAATPARLADLKDVVRFAPVVMLAAVVAGLVESADLTLLPLFGLHAGLSEREALLLVTIFMAGNVVLQMPIGLLADRLGRRAVLAACAVASAIGPLLLPLCIGEPVWLDLLLFLWGGTLYAFYSQGIALLGEEFPSAGLAAANTMFVVVYCVGGVIGPSLGGMAMDRWPHAGLPAVLGGAPLLLLAGLAARSFRRRATA